MNSEQLKSVLDEKEENRKFLFIRGFLVSDNKLEKLDEFPFYGSWKYEERLGFHFYTHPLTGKFFAPIENGELFLLGHAYNPFTMQHLETECLTRIAEHFGAEDFYDYVSELTGIFVIGYIQNGKLGVLVDPAGIQSACHGIVNNSYYLSSHPQLVADVCGLEMDDFVKELVGYKWYSRVMGPYLPADLTPFKELKRIVPNNCYIYNQTWGGVKHSRFYPVKDLTECKTNEEYQEVIEQAATILKNNMELITRKWKKPSISLTGGIDSNTTFAAANGNYDKFTAFSYCSAQKETIDCDAAKKISERFNVPWTLYQVPDSAQSLNDYDIKVAIIKHNNGYIALEKENELRKRVYLEQNINCEVEVKSWVSETIRGYWYKHYGRKRMPKLSPKLYRNLYKIFIGNRKLARKIDKIFKVYIDEFEYKNIPKQYPTADIHYNEVTWGSWGSLNISEMKFYTDITIPYNNRKFLDLLFKVPLKKRISDEHHLAMKEYLNKELYDMNIRVVNMKETKFRAFCLNLIFTMNMLLPF